MNLYRQFKTDTSLEKKGIILQYGTNSKGDPIELRVARAGGANDAFLKRLEAKTKPIRKQIQNETVERETSIALMRDLYAETVVLGWSGVEDEDGNEVAFSKAAVIKLFTDLPDMFADVQEQCSKHTLFRAELREEDAKN